MSNFKDLAKKLLIERDASTLPQKCSTQFDLPENISVHIRKLGEMVKDEHLHDCGRENEPHVTVLYGINPTPSAMSEAIAAVKECGKQNVVAKLGEISKFSNENFDVLKFEIISEDLYQMNEVLSNCLDYENDYPDYNPHLTIAYVKPGMGNFYVDQLKQAIGNRLAGKSMSFDAVMFSNTNQEKTPIELGYPQTGPVSHPETKSDLNEDLGYGAGMPSGQPYMSGHMGVYNSPNVRQNPGSFGTQKRYNMMNNNTVVASGYYDTVYDEDIMHMMKILKKLNFKVEWPSNADDYEDDTHVTDPIRHDQTHTLPNHPNPSLDHEDEGHDDALPNQGGINLSNDTIMRYLKAEFGDTLVDMHKMHDAKVTYDSIMTGLKDVMSDLQFPDKDFAFIKVLKQLIKDPKYYAELGKYDIHEDYQRNVYGTKFKPNAIKNILKGMQQ
jgi:2'-5' RNA ligase